MPPPPRYRALPLAPSLPRAQPRRFFVLKAARAFCAFFARARGAHAMPRTRSEKGEGRGETLSVLNHLEIHEESMNHLRAPTPPFRVILRAPHWARFSATERAHR